MLFVSTAEHILSRIDQAFTTKERIESTPETGLQVRSGLSLSLRAVSIDVCLCST